MLLLFLYTFFHLCFGQETSFRLYPAITTWATVAVYQLLGLILAEPTTCPPEYIPHTEKAEYIPLMRKVWKKLPNSLSVWPQFYSMVLADHGTMKQFLQCLKPQKFHDQHHKTISWGSSIHFGFPIQNPQPASWKHKNLNLPASNIRSGHANMERLKPNLSGFSYRFTSSTSPRSIQDTGGCRVKNHQVKTSQKKVEDDSWGFGKCHLLI